MIRINLIALSVACCALLVVNAGCARCGETIAERAMEQVVERATGDRASIDIGSDVDISDLPAYIRYPGAKATARSRVTIDEGTATTYGLETSDARSRVVDWYKNSFSAQGWTRQVEMETGDGVMLSFISGDEKSHAQVIVSTRENKTNVGIVHTTQAK